MPPNSGSKYFWEESYLSRSSLAASRCSYSALRLVFHLVCWSRFLLSSSCSERRRRLSAGVPSVSRSQSIGTNFVEICLHTSSCGLSHHCFISTTRSLRHFPGGSFGVGLATN